MGEPGVRGDPEMFQEGVADQVRRPVRHRADADVHVRLTEIDRPQLRVTVGDVQQRHIAEGGRVIERFRRLLGPGEIEGQRHAGRAGGREKVQEFAPVHSGFRS